MTLWSKLSSHRGKVIGVGRVWLNWVDEVPSCGLFFFSFFQGQFAVVKLSLTCRGEVSSALSYAVTQILYLMQILRPLVHC